MSSASGTAHQYTSYDACYLALTEALEAPLYPGDAKLASAGHAQGPRRLMHALTCLRSGRKWMREQLGGLGASQSRRYSSIVATGGRKKNRAE